MSNMWDRVRNLKGSSLQTIDRRKPFEIMDVDEVRVWIRPGGGKQGRRMMLRERIEEIANCRIPKENLRKHVQQQFPDTRNASYMAAIAETIRRDLEL